MGTKSKKTNGHYRNFAGKRHVRLVKVTARWPLAYEARLVWSHLVQAMRTGDGLTAAEVAERTGLHESETVPRCRESLEETGLVRAEDGVMFAVEPGDRQRAWFHHYDDGIQYVKTLVRDPSSPLSQRQVALYSLLHSYARDKSYALGLSKLGLATSLPASRQTVMDGLAALERHGLIRIHPSRDGRRFAFELPRPNATQLAWFRDTEETKYARLGEYPGLVPPSEDDVDDQPEKKPQPNPEEKAEKDPEKPQPKPASVGARPSGTNQEDEEVEDDLDEDSPFAKAMIRHKFSRKQIDDCYEAAWGKGMTLERFEGLLRDAEKMKYDAHFNCFPLFIYRLRAIPKVPKRSTANEAGSGRRDEDRPATGTVVLSDTGVRAKVEGRAVGQTPAAGKPADAQQHDVRKELKAANDETTPMDPCAFLKSLDNVEPTPQSTWLDEHPWERFYQEDDD